mgnify:CR=1 FL=1
MLDQPPQVPVSQRTNPERSFKEEVRALRLGEGEIFRGEGILAVTKAILQSGVAYVGGYQGAPVSHLLDVMVQARELVGELGVHVEACSNEASAAAMLGASIHYPVRGAVTWKSNVGTNVAADALSNLSSPGVQGGVLVVVGEEDVLTPFSDAEAMVALLPLTTPARLEWIPHAGHVPCVESPDAFVQCLSEFLAHPALSFP